MPTIPDKIYWNAKEFTNFTISSPPPPNLNVQNRQILAKKSLSKPTLSSGRGGKEGGRRNLLNFCVCSIYYDPDCLKIWEFRLSFDVSIFAFYV